MWYKFRLSDKQFTQGLPSRPDIDPATEGCQEYLQRLDFRLNRYSTSEPYFRAATSSEILDYDNTRMGDEFAGRFDTPEAKMVKALALWTASKLNVQSTTAKAEIFAIYKSL